MLLASALTSVDSGTIFVSTPPFIIPILHVVSSSILPEAIFVIASAADFIELIPFSGDTPACVALPRTVKLSLLWYGALFIIDPTEPSASNTKPYCVSCLLYTSDAADEEDSVDLGG